MYRADVNTNDEENYDNDSSTDADFTTTTFSYYLNYDDMAKLWYMLNISSADEADDATQFSN